jgi:hypothetical protein
VGFVETASFEKVATILFISKYFVESQTWNFYNQLVLQKIGRVKSCVAAEVDLNKKGDFISHEIVLLALYDARRT